MLKKKIKVMICIFQLLYFFSFIQSVTFMCLLSLSSLKIPGPKIWPWRFFLAVRMHTCRATGSLTLEDSGPQQSSMTRPVLRPSPSLVISDMNVRLPGPALGKKKNNPRNHIWLLVGQAIGINPTIILGLHPASTFQLRLFRCTCLCAF